MSFRLYPVPESKIKVVTAMIDKAHSEMNMPPLATAEQAKKSLSAGYASTTMAAYVDSLQDPKHLLILSTVPGVITEGLITVVHLIYSVPEERGNPEVIAAMHSTIENYAVFNKAGTIIGSSWVYGGSRGIDAMWKSRGYQAQETIYTKEV